MSDHVQRVYVDPMIKKLDEELEYRCAFCDKSRFQVKRIIFRKGTTTCICSGCIAKAIEVL